MIHIFSLVFQIKIPKMLNLLLKVFFRFKMFLSFSCLDLLNVLFFLLLTQSKIIVAGSTFSSHSKSSTSAEWSAKQLEASQQIEFAQPQLLSSSQIRRRKRDGGIAPLGLAVVSGIIGTLKLRNELPNKLFLVNTADFLLVKKFKKKWLTPLSWLFL